jgi:hypothetical protein
MNWRSKNDWMIAVIKWIIFINQTALLHIELLLRRMTFIVQ